MPPTILAAIGITAALGSIVAQLVYLRATLYNLHSTATCAPQRPAAAPATPPAPEPPAAPAPQPAAAGSSGMFDNILD